MSKPPLGIGVKRNDLRPWRALAPTRLSWRDPSCGNRWLPGATPPAAPPRPTTTTALLTWARRRLQLRPPVCAQTSPRRPANLSQAAPARLPDAFQTPPRRLPAVSPAVSQTSPSRLPDGSQRGGAPEGSKWSKSGKRGILAFWVKKSRKSRKMSTFSILGPQNGQNGPFFAFWPPKCEKRCPKPFV